MIATGFDDLRMRVDAQSEQAKQHQEKLKVTQTTLPPSHALTIYPSQEIQERIKNLKNLHSTSTLSKLSRYSSSQTQLTARLLGLIQHLHLLIPAIRSSSIRPEEEELRNRLEKIEEEILGGGGRSRGKVGELWAVVGALRARGGADYNNGNAEQWQVVDEDGLARIAQVSLKHFFFSLLAISLSNTRLFSAGPVGSTIRSCSSYENTSESPQRLVCHCTSGRL